MIGAANVGWRADLVSCALRGETMPNVAWGGTGRRKRGIWTTDVADFLARKQLIVQVHPEAVPDDDALSPHLPIVAEQ